MKRFLVRSVINEGVEMGLSLVEIGDDGKVLSVKPFERETARTAWVEGKAIIQNGEMTIEHKKP